MTKNRSFSNCLIECNSKINITKENLLFFYEIIPKKNERYSGLKKKGRKRIEIKAKGGQI